MWSGRRINLGEKVKQKNKRWVGGCVVVDIRVPIPYQVTGYPPVLEQRATTAPP